MDDGLEGGLVEDGDECTVLMRSTVNVMQNQEHKCESKFDRRRLDAIYVCWVVGRFLLRTRATLAQYLSVEVSKLRFQPRLICCHLLRRTSVFRSANSPMLQVQQAQRCERESQGERISNTTRASNLERSVWCRDAYELLSQDAWKCCNAISNDATKVCCQEAMVASSPVTRALGASLCKPSHIQTAPWTPSSPILLTLFLSSVRDALIARVAVANSPRLAFV